VSQVVGTRRPPVRIKGTEKGDLHRVDALFEEAEAIAHLPRVLLRLRVRESVCE